MEFQGKYFSEDVKSYITNLAQTENFDNVPEPDEIKQLLSSVDTPEYEKNPSKQFSELTKKVASILYSSAIKGKKYNDLENFSEEYSVDDEDAR